MCSLSRADASKLLQKVVKGKKGTIDRAVQYVASLPQISFDNIKVVNEVEKSTSKNVGILKCDVVVASSGADVSYNKKGLGPRWNVALVLGTSQRRVLLAHKTVGFGSTQTKSVELKFDWSAANADGGEGGGSMILRFLVEEVRGLDGHISIPLR